MNQAGQQQTVKQACQGDIDALGRLYNHYYTKLVWVAYAVLLNQDQAEEVAQQAFVIACEKLDDLRDPRCFGGWLTRICRNEANQVLRTRQRTLKLKHDPTRMVSTYTEDGELSRQIKTAVDQLPTMYREVIVLRYYEQLDYTIMADLLGISSHSVRGRLFRARQKIKRVLQQHGIANR